jgi:hypothetical protein
MQGARVEGALPLPFLGVLEDPVDGGQVVIVAYAAAGAFGVPVSGGGFVHVGEVGWEGGRVFVMVGWEGVEVEGIGVRVRSRG